MSVRSSVEFRLKSSRAPYTRGGIRFASTREAVVVPGAALSDDQLERLKADQAVTIEVVDAETGKPVDLDKTLEAEALAAEKAKADAKAAADKARSDATSKADDEAKAAAKPAASAKPKGGAGR